MLRLRKFSLPMDDNFVAMRPAPLGERPTGGIMVKRSALQAILASGVALAAMLPGAAIAQVTTGGTPEAATPTGAATPATDATASGEAEGGAGSRFRLEEVQSQSCSHGGLHAKGCSVATVIDGAGPDASDERQRRPDPERA